MVVLQSIDVFLLVYVRTVLVGKHFVYFCTSTPVAYNIEVILRFPLREEVQCIDGLFVQQQKVYIMFYEQSISLPVELSNGILIQLPHEVLRPVSQLWIVAKTVNLFTVSAVHDNFDLADKGLVDLPFGHSEEMRQLSLKIDLFRLHFP